MVNVEHSTLTGASLHEPKGVGAASSGQVYVANGAGSGVWTSISTSVNPFGTQFFHVRDEKANTTDSQILTGGIWNKRDLNTVKTNEISGASVASSQISLPVGIYYCIASAIANGGTGGNLQKIRLRNITDGTSLLVGLSGVVSAAAGSMESTLAGRFTLGGTKTIELQHWSSAGSGAQSTDSGEAEVYADVMIWKVG